MNTSAISAIIAAVAAVLATLAGAVVNSFLTKRRDHESAWRQTKIEHYQKYMAALSSIVSGRATPEGQERYADAVNALSLIASRAVLDAALAFQAEISYMNKARSDERHDALLRAVIQAMRDDIQPPGQESQIPSLKLLAPPPK